MLMSPGSLAGCACGLGYRAGPEAGAEAAKKPASAIRDDRLAECRQAVANLGRLVVGVGLVGQVPGVYVVHRLPPPPLGRLESPLIAAILAGRCANWVAQCRVMNFPRMWPALALAVGLASPAPTVDFKNSTYSNTPCGDQKVAVNNGLAWYDRGDVQFQVSVGSVKYGSLKPGTRQALVMLTCKFPVGSTSALHLYDVGATGPKDLGVLATADADSGYAVDWVYTNFKNGLLYVDRCDWASDACKTSIVTTYALRNGKLTKVYETHHPTPRRSPSP